MTKDEYKLYISGPFLSIKEQSGLSLSMNIYGVLKGASGGVMKPEKNANNLRYYARSKYKNMRVDVVKNAHLLFGSTDKLLSKKQVERVWSMFHGKPLDHHSRRAHTVKTTTTRSKGMSFNEHKCHTKGCNNTILKSATWCEDCKRARMNDLSAYSGCRVSITGSTVTSNVVTSNLR